MSTYRGGTLYGHPAGQDSYFDCTPSATVLSRPAVPRGRRWPCRTTGSERHSARHGVGFRKDPACRRREMANTPKTARMARTPPQKSGQSSLVASRCAIASEAALGTTSISAGATARNSYHHPCSHRLSSMKVSHVRAGRLAVVRRCARSCLMYSPILRTPTSVSTKSKARPLRTNGSTSSICTRPVFFARAKPPIVARIVNAAV